MLADLLLLGVLLLLGRQVPRLPPFAWAPSAWDRILAAVILSTLLGWCALFSAYGWQGLTTPEPAPRAVQTVAP